MRGHTEGSVDAHQSHAQGGVEVVDVHQPDVQGEVEVVDVHQSDHERERGVWTTCSGCAWEFRPAYTDWTCPMCGRQAPREPAAVPALERFSWWLRTGKNGVILKGGAFVLANLTLSFAVLWLYFRQ